MQLRSEYLRKKLNNLLKTIKESADMKIENYTPRIASELFGTAIIKADEAFIAGADQ